MSILDTQSVDIDPFAFPKNDIDFVTYCPKPFAGSHRHSRNKANQGFGVLSSIRFSSLFKSWGGVLAVSTESGIKCLILTLG